MRSQSEVAFVAPCHPADSTTGRYVMIFYTELEHLPAYDVEGEYLGRLEDLGVVVQEGFDCMTKYPMELEL